MRRASIVCAGGGGMDRSCEVEVEAESLGGYLEGREEEQDG